ncbi:amidase family protein [Aliidiomarina maris]|uniref:Amidase/aspartyl-tRNA(Asn)/glutamyl-tRNA(Gln) amidotransferase subunit A n=2 Tax=Aliidiomarina maris TaxID=531312 RepID=A0A327WSS0_9GAMM|nr:amidase family protein [Aliidiomarina maris]RAJ95354.1 amidase/aspartyl-tRNA(Asn)/glutamyl-tRNA(Gln) amidotransferase subunit A [Aliidiomarina maris]
MLKLMRLRHLYIAWLMLAIAACSPASQPEVNLSHLSAAQAQQLLDDGYLTSEQLVRYYLAQIETYNPRLAAIVDVNPDAIAQAQARDAERHAGQARSPLHGLPIVLKANIASADSLPTTAGAQVLAGFTTAQDAELVSRLRDAGLIILGKANLSEWANFRGYNSISGWSGLGGQTLNPYFHTHTPCGSSSGSGVAPAADLTLLAIGTETDGSIMCPASVNGVVGVKPTRGSVSGHGIIPIASAQDIAGPMTRYVYDARLLLEVIAEPQALRRMHQAPVTVQRVVLVRAFDSRFAGVEQMTERVARHFNQQNIDVVEVNQWQLPEGLGDAELEALIYEFKRDLNAWLEEFGAPTQAANIDAIIAYNQATSEQNLALFGQEYLERAAAIDLETEKDSYQQALGLSRELATSFLDELLQAHAADAIVVPSYGPAWPITPVEGDVGYSFGTATPAAVAGYPSVTLRAGQEGELPLGISLIGLPYTEWRLLDLAERLEQDGMGFAPPAP